MKIAFWTFALTPVIGLVLFYSFAPSSATEEGLAISKTRPMTDGAQIPAPTNQRAKNEDQIHKLQLEITQSKDRLIEAQERSARTAEYFTPEVQQKMVDNKMRAREPHYRSLFNSWAIAKETIDRALDIIKDRESELMAHQWEFVQNGRNRSRVDYEKETLITGSIAEVQLVDLLGQDRFVELSRLESQIKSEAISRVRNLND